MSGYGLKRAIEILLVEDSPSDRLIAIAALEDAKIINSLNVVENGVDALCYLRKEGPFANARRPDLILLDLNLPKMDGREVLAQIKEDRVLSAIPVIVLTTSTASDDVARAYGRHANGYITKPVDFARFGEALRAIGNYWFEVVTLPSSSAIERVSRATHPGPKFEPESSERRARVLVFHPDPGAASELARTFADVPGFLFDIEHVSEVAVARERLVAQPHDLIFAAIASSDPRDVEAFDSVRISARGAPVVAWTRDTEEALGLAAVRNGAHDALIASEWTPRSIRRVVQHALETKWLREQLLFSQRSEAVGQIAGGVAHDFNNLLTVVKANANLIASSKADPELVELAGNIQEAAERGANLSRQLLSFSGRRGLERVHFELNEVIGGFTRMLRRVLGDSIRLQLQLGVGLMPLIGDVAMVEQVVLNLALNARDAMPDGGKLTFQTSQVVLDAVRARALHADARAGRYTCMSVRDTGTGIPSNSLSRIFEPFFTTKKLGKGTGLGLSNVSAIARDHGGFVTVRSELGVGTAFDVWFAADTTTVAAVVPPTPPLDARDASGTILLVEDEPSVRAAAKRILRGRSLRVLEAGSVDEALALWEEQRESIDLLLTDFVVSEAMNGLELAKRLRASKPSLKVILTSGHSEAIAMASVEPGEEVAFLRKPYGVEALRRIVGKTLA